MTHCRRKLTNVQTDYSLQATDADAEIFKISVRLFFNGSIFRYPLINIYR
jgi:hypothetical protein